MTTTIERTSITEQIEQLVLEQILDGSLPAGERINESQLAERLGASRTPLREALSRLHREGLVVSRPHRGFFVADLSAREAGELYECLAMLESSALELAGCPDSEQLTLLARLNDRLEGVRDATEGIERNTAWHRHLLAGCPNRQLLDLTESVRTRVHRYEFAFFAPGPARIATSVRLHGGILDRLGEGDVDAAKEALIDHWFTDLEELAPRPS